MFIAHLKLMKKSLVFLFAGQGSQFFQMAKSLYFKHPSFQQWMLKLNQIVLDAGAESILDKIYDESKGRNEYFERLQYTHPAIFMVEYSLAQILLEEGISPAHVLGASLGEFTAAAVAGVVEAGELLQMLIHQAKIIESKCQPGGMIAIIHNARLYHEETLIHKNSELAAVNYDSHFVIAGAAEKLREIETFLKSASVLYQRLPVLYGFHSSGIDSGAGEFKNYLNQKIFLKPRLSFISSLHGCSVGDLHQEHFWDVVRKPVHFRNALEELENMGHHTYLDLSPGGTLAGFAKRNLSRNSVSDTYSIITPFHQDLKNLETIAKLFSR